MLIKSNQKHTGSLSGLNRLQLRHALVHDHLTAAGHNPSLHHLKPGAQVVMAPVCTEHKVCRLHGKQAGVTCWLRSGRELPLTAHSHRTADSRCRDERDTDGRRRDGAHGGCRKRREALSAPATCFCVTSTWEDCVRCVYGLTASIRSAQGQKRGVCTPAV